MSTVAPTPAKKKAVPSDIEIAQAAKIKPIRDIAAKLGIPDSAISPYGHTKAKISLEYIETLKGKPDGKLILVTAISPTPAGEGKTTTTVGLGDALQEIGKKAIICLREPSLGPVFGVRAARPAAATRRSCRWRTSTSTSPATSTPSAPPTTCWPR